MSYFIHESSYVDDGVKIGEECSIGQNVNITDNVIMGNEMKVKNNVSAYEDAESEDCVFLGLCCVFTNGLTLRVMYLKGRENCKRTIIREEASTGDNATIVCGHTIGRYAIVAAGEVVTNDVSDFDRVVGVSQKLLAKKMN